MSGFVDAQRAESLGPTERTLQVLLTHGDHMVHNRPGVVEPAPGTATGVRWSPATHRDGVLFRIERRGRKSVRVPLGTMDADGKVRQSEEWQQKWNPFSQCSWPPEDDLIENFRQTVFDRAQEVIGADLAQTEKFTTSVKDGIDIRLRY